MRYILLFAFFTFGGHAAAQDCEVLPSEEYREACRDLAHYRVSPSQFCETVVEFEGGTIESCLSFTQGFQPIIANIYAERERTGWAAPQEGSLWTTYNWPSEFTDRPMAMLSVESDEGMGCSTNPRDNKTANLLVSCLEGEMAVEIVTQCYMSELRNGGSVYYRIGSHPAETTMFSVDDKNRRLGIWNHEDALSIALQMVDSDRAIFQFTPFDKPQATVRFNLAGFADEVWPIRDECLW